MPTFSRFASILSRTKKFLTICFIFIVQLSAYCIYPIHTQAATDPINATVSATARVPSTTPTTGDEQAPPPVILISPHDGATTNQSRPELVWKATFDPNSNYLTYTVYLNGVATYLGVSNTGNTQHNNYISHIGDGNIYLTPILDLPIGIYDWQVRATDGSGNSSYSTTWRFTIDQTPPLLTVVNIDDVYTNPSIIEGSIFDLSGPKEVKIIFATEPYATVSLTINASDGRALSYSLPTDNSGIATLLVTLPLGSNTIIATSFDSAGLTTTLPAFILNLAATKQSGLLTPNTLPTLHYLSNIPNNLVSLPATISQIKDTQMIAFIPYVLLAIALLILLIIIWNRRSNILIIDKLSQKPYRSLIVYHSRPTHSAHFRLSPSHIFITNHEPVLYSLPSGQAFIRSLGRYSSLTIRTPDGNTHIMSISKNSEHYTISLQ